MKRNFWFKIISVVGIAVFFVAAGLYAKGNFPDMIKMKTDAYKKHTKGIVDFSHKKHSDDYKIGCGECHHDKDGKPLNNLKKGDDVQKCVACHSKPGELKGKEAKGKSDAEKRQYHANALHDNCIDCHKKYNRENKTRSAPQTCTQCHPREKK